MRADARIRTADPFITNEVLYQLSYAGARLNLAGLHACRFSLRSFVAWAGAEFK